MPDTLVATELQVSPGMTATIFADDFFIGPDGRDYRGAFGPIVVVKAEQVLGFKPKNSADWFVQIGDNLETAVFIAGCRIHYFNLSPKKPPNSVIFDTTKG